MFVLIRQTGSGVPNWDQNKDGKTAMQRTKSQHNERGERIDEL